MSFGYDLSDEHAQFRDTVRAVRRGVAGAGRRAARPRGPLPRRAGRAAAELGLLGIPLPGERGGAGFDTLAYAIAIEELARVDSSFAITVAAHTVARARCRSHLFGTTSSSERVAAATSPRAAAWRRSG